MSLEDELIEEIKKWTTKLDDALCTAEARNDHGDKMLSNIRAYRKDSGHFLERGDLIELRVSDLGLGDPGAGEGTRALEDRFLEGCRIIELALLLIGLLVTSVFTMVGLAGGLLIIPILVLGFGIWRNILIFLL